MNRLFRQLKPEKSGIYLDTIRSIFPEAFSDGNPGLDDIENYYTHSFWGYALFHSRDGAMHMALSSDGEFSIDDFSGQAERVTEAIQSMPRCQRVLEIGCGRGFNTRLLSKAFPEVEFVGVDLNALHIQQAKADTRSQKNVTFVKGGFDQLDSLDLGTFDLIYAVESLCHSLDLRVTLSSIQSVLREGGTLVVMDGFRGKPVESNREMSDSVRLVERSMAVPRFFDPSEFHELAAKLGWISTREEDLSDQIMPNLLRLADFAKAFFKFPLLARLLRHILPLDLAKNAIAGLFMPITVKLGYHQYRLMEWRKPACLQAKT
jgi:SAM-dependent methyltransferase